FANGRVVSPAGISDTDTEPVEAHLRLLQRRDASRAPPPLRHVLDRRLDDTLAVPVPRRARINPDAVVLRHWRERPLDPVSALHDHRRHPIHPPSLRRPAEPAEYLVDPDHEMGLVVRVGQP